jgi:hypothetical protein
MKILNFEAMEAMTGHLDIPNKEMNVRTIRTLED